MEFSSVIQDDLLIIMLQEEKLDAKLASSFKEQFVTLIQQANLKKVIFDLNQLHFIDSAGLGTFLFIQRALNKQEGNLKLAHLNKPIQALFEMVSMQRMFDIYPTVEDAIKSF